MTKKKTLASLNIVDGLLGKYNPNLVIHSTGTQGFMESQFPRILKAFSHKKEVDNLVKAFEDGFFSGTLRKLDDIVTPELALAILLEVVNARSASTNTAKRNAKAKIDANATDILRSEARNMYAQEKGRRKNLSKSDFAHDFSASLEGRKQAADAEVVIAKRNLLTFIEQQPSVGAQVRKRPETKHQLEQLEGSLAEAEAKAKFKVFSSRTIQDDWLKGL